MPSIWRTCCAWVGCLRRGSPRQRPGSCGNWCATGPSSWLCGRDSRPRWPRDLIELYDREVAMLEGQIHRQLRGHGGYRAIQAINGIGPTIAAILVAEIGEVGRFRSAEALCSWAGLTPKHRESDTKTLR